MPRVETDRAVASLAVFGDNADRRPTTGHPGNTRDQRPLPCTQVGGVRGPRFHDVAPLRVWRRSVRFRQSLHGESHCCLQLSTPTRRQRKQRIAKLPQVAPSRGSDSPGLCLWTRRARPFRGAWFGPAERTRSLGARRRLAAQHNATPSGIRQATRARPDPTQSAQRGKTCPSVVPPPRPAAWVPPT